MAPIATPVNILVCINPYKSVIARMNFVMYIMTLASKKCIGGFNSSDLDNEVVLQFESYPENNRCHAKIMISIFKSDVAFTLEKLHNHS